MELSKPVEFDHEYQWCKHKPKTFLEKEEVKINSNGMSISYLGTRFSHHKQIEENLPNITYSMFFLFMCHVLSGT